MSPANTSPPPDTSSITRPGSVTYHIPTFSSPRSSFSSPSTSNTIKTTIHLPPHSSWTSGLHWHNNSTEYLHLVRGSIFVTLGTTTQVYHAASAGEEEVVLRVDPGVRHNWGRAEGYLHLKSSEKDQEANKQVEEEVVVSEWTSPSSILKPLFFWNLNRVLMPSTTPGAKLPPATRVLRWMLGGYWIPFQLFVIFYALDNYPVFISLEGLGLAAKVAHLVEHILTFTVLFVASLVGGICGVEAVSEERTPVGLWEAWERKQYGKKEKSL